MAPAATLSLWLRRLLPSLYIILAVLLLVAAGMCPVGVDGRSGARGCWRYESANNNYSSGECAEA